MYRLADLQGFGENQRCAGCVNCPDAPLRIGEPVLAVSGDHLQPVKVCHQLSAFFVEPLPALVPIFSSRQVFVQ
ncbi:MAG: hypothetical protein A3E79_13005 [Burkholderiales bacterium RIFCSPHIGHO2_12_FULL_61_11]|nr:MAG: hypothetical protein A3E79_13005 [Burkholderiales bacterium RIFCSPHIGHO2_12_FULL_61_11]